MKAIKYITGAIAIGYWYWFIFSNYSLSNKQIFGVIIITIFWFAVAVTLFNKES